MIVEVFKLIYMLVVAFNTLKRPNMSTAGMSCRKCCKCFCISNLWICRQVCILVYIRLMHGWSLAFLCFLISGSVTSGDSSLQMHNFFMKYQFLITVFLLVVLLP